MTQSSRWQCGAVVLLVALGALGVLAERGQAQADKGEKIVFSSFQTATKSSGVAVVNADGSGQKNLSKEGAFEMDPALSPDGKQIAFLALDIASKKGDLFAMKADGSDRKQLTRQAAETLAIGPSWSPDGKRIAYSTISFAGGGAPKDMAVYVMDADGKNAKKIGDGMMPAWSPDGKQILYTAMGDLAKFEPALSIMDADGKNSKELLKKAMMGTYSPDGKRIVCMALSKAVPDILVMNADGSGKTPLTQTEDEVEMAPRWSADGKRIFFNRAPTKGPPESLPIYVMDADGKNVQQVTKNKGMDLLAGSAVILMRTEARKKAPSKP